jgi:catechol-2,3-dioxygenase
MVKRKTRYKVFKIGKIHIRTRNKREASKLYNKWKRMGLKV